MQTNLHCFSVLTKKTNWCNQADQKNSAANSCQCCGSYGISKFMLMCGIKLNG